MIRKAQIEDFLDIARLDRSSWVQNKHSEFIPDGEHVWRIWCEHAIVAVAEQNGVIIGAVLAFRCTDDDYCLHKIFVDRDARGKGVGIELMNYVLQIADERCFTMFLTVDPDNTKARILYESCGFTEKRFYSGYYREHEDRLVLTRRPKRR